MQPLRYRTVTSEEECAAVFPLLAWAGYLTDWDGPEEGERPTAYNVQCLDTRLTSTLLCDDGLQLQAITLGATALGFGGCIIKSFNASEIKNIVQLPDNLIALCTTATGRRTPRSGKTRRKNGRREAKRRWNYIRQKKSR